MHELGVVFHCVDQVNDIAKENEVSKINSVTVQIGAVSTVVPELFEDCWNWAVKKETVLKDAKINIETIEAITHCSACGKDYDTLSHGKVCPNCGSDDTYLIQGNEIIIKSIEVLDALKASE